jgi:3-phenylpropionate/trans-cinnamate dioxygenase ferredoxin subunit
MTATVICTLDDLTDGEARRYDIDGSRLALVRVGEQVFCIQDRCSHEDFSLAEGEVLPELLEIECARHGATFELTTGQPCSLPATKPVAVYDVVVRDGLVEVEL